LHTDSKKSKLMLMRWDVW